MNRSGPSGQPLRGMAANAFHGQPGANTRSGALGSGRLQNTKLAGTASGWGNYSGMAGAPLPSSRGPSSGPGGFPSSFAQTIGGGQNQAPLDLSEFPSLSGGPQPASSATPAVWNTNAGLRSTQQPIQQRQIGQSSSHQQQQQQQQQPPPPQQQHRSMLSIQSSRAEESGESQAAALMEGFQFGGQRQVAQQGGSEDFPPLGGLGPADMGVSRATMSVQGSHINGLLGHGRDGDHSVGAEGSNDSAALGSASRSQLEALQLDHDVSSRLANNSAHPEAVQAKPSASELTSGAPSGALPYRPANDGSDLTRDAREKRPGQGQEPQGEGSRVNEVDRHGFQGFLEKIQGGTDQAGLAWGLDLNTLGLDLGRIDGQPLYRDWAGPFADPTQRGVMPVFQLPQAYTIQNVPPLESKIGSFSDETLFAIFYQCPRDVAQDLAASELYARDWRWHKKLQQWMMKAKEFGEPQMLPSMKEERGYYYFFDANNWRRERKEFILNYEHLYHGQVQAMPPSLP